MAPFISSSAHLRRPPPPTTTCHAIIKTLTLLALLAFNKPTSALTLNLTTFTGAANKFRFSGQGRDYSNKATIENGSLVLNDYLTWVTGLAIYNESYFHLWDAASRSLADFSTHFSFVIDSQGSTPKSDGIVFFLAPMEFPAPDVQEGKWFGLVGGRGRFPFVAVEFDTYQNDVDLEADHVGIDVSWRESVKGIQWKSGVTEGKLSQARIVYKADSKVLSVEFTGFENNETIWQSLSYTIDLRNFLPEFVCLGFGAATGEFPEINKIESWSFDSKLVGFNDTSNTTPPPSKSTGSPQPSVVGAPSNRLDLIAGSVASGVVVLIGLVGLILWMKRGRNKELPLEINEEFENETGPKRYSYLALERATIEFDEKNKLGEGGFGQVYKGLLDGTLVAIKRVSKGSKQGLKEYVSEVRVISKLRHRNLVQLLGWCHQGDELLLVYEFMPNGSLDMHLFDSKIVLSWESRFKIAQGLASALLYLHEGCDQYVVHRDIKSSNVMLDFFFNAKLGDFGLARLVDHQKLSDTTIIAGTRGYIDPESVVTGKITKHSDVYSFGVLILEVACGRKPIDPEAPENEGSLVDWVYDLHQEGKLLDATDPKLNTEDYNEAELRCLLIVGLWCAQPTQISRPNIRQASLVLNFEAPLPTLPSRTPNSIPYLRRHNARRNGLNVNQSETKSPMATTSSSIHSIT